MILPTSEAIKYFFEFNGLKCITTHIRESPTNIDDEISSTTLNEHNVVLKQT